MGKPQLDAVLRHLRALADPQAAGASDAALLERFVVHREEAAFAALLSRHGTMVLGVSRRVLGQDQDAEDVFQATFLLLARKAGSIRKPESVAG
jgi:DNA-directed RNA polymerase specialized sigma24 family protein